MPELVHPHHHTFSKLCCQFNDVSLSWCDLLTKKMAACVQVPLTRVCDTWFNGDAEAHALFLAALVADDAMVAGSAGLHLIHPQFTPNDMDIWSIKPFVHLLNFFAGSEVLHEFVSLVDNGEHLQDAITFRRQGKKFQLLETNVASLPTIIASFDLGCSQVWWDGQVVNDTTHRVYYNRQTFNRFTCLSHITLNPENDCGQMCTQERIAKYQKRGITFVMSLPFIY